MVKVTNGKDIFDVTLGAFKCLYKNKGYKIIESKQNDIIDEPHDTEVEVDPFAELLEKPISQWTKNEVKSFAADREINITGTKNVNEAKIIIKNYLSEEE